MSIFRLGFTPCSMKFLARLTSRGKKRSKLFRYGWENSVFFLIARGGRGQRFFADRRRRTGIASFLRRVGGELRHEKSRRDARAQYRVRCRWKNLQPVGGREPFAGFAR